MRRQHFLFFAVFFLLMVNVCRAHALFAYDGRRVIRVPLDYETIQGAVDAAGVGDVVLVMAGTYYEHVLIDKPLFLVGENPSTTVIDGNGTGTIINVVVDGVVVDGFTLRNAYTGVFLDSKGNEVANSKIMFCSWDGAFVNVSDYNVIRNNEFSNNGDGYPGLWWGGGVCLSGSNSNIVSDNVMHDNVLYGVGVIIAVNNSITRNVIMNNLGAGIYMLGASYNDVTKNTVKNNSCGMEFHDDSLYPTCDNVFYYNNFMGNRYQLFDVYASYPNYWNSSEGEGNYWSDYEGKDLDGDLIGDTNLPHQEVDNHPLMIPYGLTTYTFKAHWGDADYPVTIETDSAIEAFSFSQPEKQVSFNVTRPKYAQGTCNVTIPKELLQDNPWIIRLDTNNITETTSITESQTHTTIYLNIEQGSHIVQIIGTIAIPELKTPTILIIFTSTTIISTVFTKLSKKETHRQCKPLTRTMIVPSKSRNSLIAKPKSKMPLM
jgi:parallel beta-helix repeat protein